MAATHSTTNSACLDLFAGGLLRDSDEKTTVELVEKAWGEDPRLCVQILMHARDCRGGKGERKCVFNALKWVKERKPKTYKGNLETFISLGCFRDLIQLSEDGPQSSAAGNDVELKLFSSQLRKDMAVLKEMESKTDEEKRKVSISLAAKWAPSEKSKWKTTAKLLAKMLFPGDPAPKMKYRKSLSKLRARLNVVETLMTTNKWEDIKFGRVPSRAHKLYKGAFQRHQKERYAQFLSDVSSGKKTIKSQGVQPHELVRHFLELDKAEPPPSEEENKMIEAQWNAIIDRIRKSGHLDRAIAVVDVSGSMSGRPSDAEIRRSATIRRAREGAQIGKLCVTLMWEDITDMAIHVTSPSGERICWQNMRSGCGGIQDVDMNITYPFSTEAVENIFWDDPPEGKYVVQALNYCTHVSPAFPDPRREVKFRVMLQRTGYPTEVFSGAVKPAHIQTCMTFVHGDQKSRVQMGGPVVKDLRAVEPGTRLYDVPRMSGPLEGAIALGIMVSQLASEPFKSRLLTFSETPEWHAVPTKSNSLREMVTSVKNMKWGLSSKLHKVFDLILQLAEEHKLKQEQLPQTLFIFSDMEFDTAVNNEDGSHKTILERSKETFSKAGYELPRIVFWNLRASTNSFPSSGDTRGVALVSGYSPDLVSQFMRKSEAKKTPQEEMKDTVSKYLALIDPSEI